MPAPGENEDEDMFFRDMAECVATHQEVGPALVWPRNADGVLRRLRTEHERALAAGTAPDRPADRHTNEDTRPLVRLVAERLRTLVGASAVRVAFQDLAAGETREGLLADADTLLITIRGGLECSVRSASAAPPRRHLPLTLRMRVGEVLYVPRSYPFSLTGGRSPSTVLQLGLVPAAPRTTL
ncbi:hypothetical protein [Streptomyces sp. NRRL B-24085]|uniref:hypothetical protein n=1 Tax=Streptomyces sp. NRRL B-24085 TaxID=1709476 RepID=UPI0006B345EA|nr:hypothetical protein [Streptomyces sp. NRRL B-24085]